MAWSDAARRAAVLARRMRRVQRFNTSGRREGSQKQYNFGGFGKEDQKNYLTAKISQRFNRMRHYARNRMNQPREHTFGQLLHVETGGASTRKKSGLY